MSATIDKIMKNRGLRTLFDIGSNEWKETKIEKKIELLKELIKENYDLPELLMYYKAFYYKIGKTHVISNIENSLATLLQHIIGKQSI